MQILTPANDTDPLAALKAAHDALSESLENPSQSNAMIRAHGIALCEALNAVYPAIGNKINEMREGLDQGASLVDDLVAAWCSGKIAPVVNGLEEWADAYRTPAVEAYHVKG